MSGCPRAAKLSDAQRAERVDDGSLATATSVRGFDWVAYGRLAQPDTARENVVSLTVKNVTSSYGKIKTHVPTSRRRVYVFDNGGSFSKSISIDQSVCSRWSFSEYGLSSG